VPSQTSVVSIYRGSGLRFERMREIKASRESKLIFELVKYIGVLQFIYLKVWQSSWILELRVSVILTVVK
jgi:hypothetical protein